MNTIRIVKAKNGHNTLLIDGRYIHSAYRPDSDGANIRLDDDKLYILFGVGLGYMAFNLVSNNPNARIIIFEPLTDLADRFRSEYPHIMHLSSVLFLTHIEYEPVYNFISKHSGYGSKRIELLTTPYCEIMAEPVQFVLESVKKIYEIYVQNMFTRSNFAQLWTRNYIYNLSMLSEVPLCRINDADNANHQSENLAVIAGAGPTLDSAWSDLTEHRERLTIICVDTAIKPMLTHGITPDFIMTLDGQLYSLDDFTAVVPSASYIISELTSFYQINRDYDNVQFILNDDKHDNLAKYFLNSLGHNTDQYVIPVSGTVADFALKFAAAVGFRHIALLGIDLGYPRLCTHARQTPAYNRMFASSDYFSSLDTQNVRIISDRRLTTVRNKNGGETMSDFVLSHYADGFADFAAAHPDIRLYNIISDGADIPNTENISLSALVQRLDTHCRKQYIASHILHNVIIDRKSVIDALEHILQLVYGCSETVRTLYEQTDWSDSSDQQTVAKWDSLFRQIYTDLPFLHDWTIMQDIVYARQHNSDMPHDLSYYRNTGFVLLQSCCFIVRTLQKTL